MNRGGPHLNNAQAGARTDKPIHPANPQGHRYYRRHLHRRRQRKGGRFGPDRPRQFPCQVPRRDRVRGRLNGIRGEALAIKAFWCSASALDAQSRTASGAAQTSRTPGVDDSCVTSRDGTDSLMETTMFRVLVIGYAPEAVDFKDPAIPPGLDETRVAEGIQRDLQRMRDRGWVAEHLPIRPDENLRQQVLDHLNSQSYNCIVIGAGVRMTEKHVPEFEVVVNAVRQGAPETPLAFNSSPDSSGEAAARWLSDTQASARG